VSGAGSSALEPARVLRRVERVSLGWALVGLLVFLPRDLGAALALTLGATVSIVSFRGLQGLVGRLGAAREGTVDPRSRRRIFLRFLLLLLTPLVALWLEPERLLALVAGLSVLPLALLTEAFFQIFAISKTGRNHGS
jgi:hypothetical protein